MAITCKSPSFLIVKPQLYLQLFISLGITIFVYLGLNSLNISNLLIIIICGLSFLGILYAYLFATYNTYIFGSKSFARINKFRIFKKKEKIYYRNINMFNIRSSVNSINYYLTINKQEKSKVRSFFFQYKTFSIPFRNDNEMNDAIDFLKKYGLDFDESL